MEVPITLPLDHDGFLRRECPRAESAEAPTSYFCPLCGEPAGTESWYTQEQLDYIRGVSIAAATRSMNQELGQAFRSLKNNKSLTVRQTGEFNVPDEPMPLTDADDMTTITSPCHPYEPVKVPETQASPFHCLVCGAPYAV